MKYLIQRQTEEKPCCAVFMSIRPMIDDKFFIPGLGSFTVRQVLWETTEFSRNITVEIDYAVLICDTL